MNFPPSVFLIAHLCSFISQESLSLSFHTTHTHMHTCKGIFFLVSHHHSTSTLPETGRECFKKDENLSIIILRDLTMLTIMNSFIFHLYSSLQFTKLLSIYYCTWSYLLEPCETDKGRLLVPFCSGFDSFKVKDKMKIRNWSNFIAGIIKFWN